MTATTPSAHPVGRFAPSPSGRMHLGNIFTALVSWLSVRSAGGRWILRIEDLDPQRSRLEHSRAIEDDLRWLGLDWDEGGLDNLGPSAPYSQSRRSVFYADALRHLRSTGRTYPCFCTRADLMATRAPHQSDGRVVYAGTCRPSVAPPFAESTSGRPHSTRLWVPDSEIRFTDRVCGPVSSVLSRDCGDFVIQRADGAWAYQLAVVVDDALMGVTEVVRGNDLLLSSPQQIYLYRLLGYEPPAFAHLPLVCNSAGIRLSKRDRSLSMEHLRLTHTPQQLIGRLAFMAGLSDSPSRPCTAASLIPRFSWDAIPRTPAIILGQ